MLPFLASCQALKYKPVDAREVSPDPKDRVRKNIEEGRGFRIMGGKKGGTFDFASSNPLWRAALDTIDFMPLVSANYSGGIVITDWYSESGNEDESIKISIRFVSNEIRTDALNIKYNFVQYYNQMHAYEVQSNSSTKQQFSKPNNKPQDRQYRQKKLIQTSISSSC